MARIAYPEEQDHPELSELIAQIRSERGGRLLNLYKMLLNSPPLAAGWLHLFTAIRQQCQLPGTVRELLILRVAVINGAEYEYKAHIPFALKEGLAQEQIHALENWQNSGLFNEPQRAVLAYADSMTKEIHVPDAVFAVVRQYFNPRQVVELTATIAGYNLVSRFLEALQVDPD
ncbi:MAG TPA: carboxymuconolactone decarboxylase family protein [Acidiferrobacterales bacterium]|nr:carboxymuconolactone decarboxylase family protein [Acidiferrobacterales bacterium]